MLQKQEGLCDTLADTSRKTGAFSSSSGSWVHSSFAVNLAAPGRHVVIAVELFATMRVVVGPFVDMIPAVLAPLIAKRLNNWADHRDTNSKAKAGPEHFRRRDVYKA